MEVLYICEDSQPKLVPATITENNVINIESKTISINKIEEEKIIAN